MYRIDGTIQGVAPLLFSRMTEEALEGINTGTGGGKFSQDQRLAEGLARCHRDERGCYIPRLNFKNSLLEGCRKANLKEGRAAMAPYLEATVFPQDDLLLGKQEPDRIFTTWGRRPPKTGGACLLRYPLFEVGWTANFSMLVVDDRRSPEHIRRALEEAGLLVGIGSWRPEYGRFVVTAWSTVRE